MVQESIPAALTKDKKRVQGHEVAVHLAWKSTLYITNFPEGADDTFIRTLFGKAGRWALLMHVTADNHLFVVRRNLRRPMAEQEVQEHPALLLRSVHIPGKSIVVVLYGIWANNILQASAESALELNGTDVADGLKMSVYISNPERKKERTDSDANDREVYVAGLSKLVTKKDLQDVFKTVRAPFSIALPFEG